MQISGEFQQTIPYANTLQVQLFHNDEADSPGYAAHWHTALEIIYPVENGFGVKIDNTFIEFAKNDIMIIAPGTVHTICAPQTGCRTIILFEYGTFYNIKDMNLVLHSLTPYLIITREKHGSLHENLASTIEKVTEEYDHFKPFSEASIYNLLLHFFLSLGKANFSGRPAFSGISAKKQNEYMEMILSASNFIAEHCTENITIDDMASAAGFSKSHFTKLFKQFAGVTCYDYLIKQRISHATTLLADPDLPITYITAQSGFNSLTTFNRVFKAEKGYTPSAYRCLV